MTMTGAQAKAAARNADGSLPAIKYENRSKPIEAIFQSNRQDGKDGKFS